MANTKVIRVEENKVFATSNCSKKTVVMKNGSYVRVKLGFQERVWDKASRKHSQLQEDGFTLMKMSKSNGLYVIVGNIWFSATPSNQNGGIELNFKTVKPTGLTEDTYKMRDEKNTTSHEIVRRYLLTAQNFKSMKFETLYSAYLNGCREN